jgi:hypothetical protein
MKFTDAIKLAKGRGYFQRDEIPEIKKKAKAINQQLHRWEKAGKITPLKKGMYTIPEKFTKVALNPEFIANMLNGHNSYITGLWFISTHGFIPEGVITVTSATPGPTSEYETHLGRFNYDHMETQGFFGYKIEPDFYNRPVRIALPEKAILDFFWFEKIHETEWNILEFQRWRLEDPWKKLNLEKLNELAKQWNHPRILKAAENFTAYIEHQRKYAPWT